LVKARFVDGNFTAFQRGNFFSIVVNAGDAVKEVKNGKLADVAPTILKLMGIEQPAAMTGQALV
jgi:bisphosphoglycerate-independent phosphoglycerate mutase (AlkP superfamily)